MNIMCKGHSLTMALLYLIIALIIQGSITNANGTEEIQIDSQESLNITEASEEVFKDEEKEDWVDMFILPDTPLYPTSSADLMAQATDSEKSPEEQIEEIKEIAEKITLAIQSEMANLLSLALSVSEKENEDENQNENKLRKKRTVETPMASSQLIARLLKHIKNTNEYQNIAVEKMMTAQEIADKYGIEYRPDTEILSDLALAANQNAKEMTSILKDACDMKCTAKRDDSLEPLMIEEPTENEAYYFYGDHFSDHDIHHPLKHEVHSNPQPEFNHFHYNPHPNHNYYNNHPYESQIPSPVQNYYSPPVSKKPNFYDTVDYYPYCSMEPMSSPILSNEESIEPEPELVGEEFEETITSRVLVDRGEEPGAATVNHVMTYTVSEKSHFRTPEIERLPQQMQYCFFLM